MIMFIKIVVFVILAFIIGSVSSAIVGLSRRGCFLTIIIGLIGAFIGNILSSVLGFPDLLYLRFSDKLEFPLMWSLIGTILFVWIISLALKRK
ncbi:MAG: hypothetical protein B6D57_03590 [Candidatus Coatesbacteria bacterium 4484_99]|uniref:Transglycosylase n=1 Tax=Candidatus Coatesbacteria bacterium 4484_99 TaxID=1970774 RepID=A0A1W9S0N4_9BACT|nr:MAG: hypothetical protein B6D57_03590 [Candidatus Coatesbacteria bacterium 4484_99]